MSECSEWNKLEREHPLCGSTLDGDDMGGFISINLFCSWQTAVCESKMTPTTSSQDFHSPFTVTAFPRKTWSLKELNADKKVTVNSLPCLCFWTRSTPIWYIVWTKPCACLSSAISSRYWERNIIWLQKRDFGKRMAAAVQGGIVWSCLSLCCLESSGSRHGDAQPNLSSVGEGSRGWVIRR